ncbi:glycosyltransferase family 2 protein [Weissella paramesenteroides]|uniref:glycosyltransferase family 2 protein n=1 Tax=Weissella paramesenteroides TaxID=1249 RepID=UPI003D365DE0
MTLKVTVIVPIYNGRDYVEELVDNLYNQSFESVEFMIIDDGSTDGTFSILESRVKSLHDSRFQIISKKNTGVSDTRNLGIVKAKGEYLIFVDADDNIPKNFVKKYYDKISKNGTDIEFFPFNKTQEISKTKLTGEQIAYDKISSKNMLTSSQLLKLIFDFSLPGYPFAYISKRVLWNSSKFPKDIYFTEDLYALVDILSNTQVKGHINRQGYYNYVQRSTSIMHNSGEKEEIVSDIVTKRIIDLLISRSMDKHLIKLAMNFSLGHYIVHCENAVIRKNTALFLNYKKVLWNMFWEAEMPIRSRINKFIKITILFIPSKLILRKVLIYKRILTEQEPIK